MSIFDLGCELGEETTDDLGHTHYSFDEAGLVSFFSSVYSMGARKAVSEERKVAAAACGTCGWLMDGDISKDMTKEQAFEYGCHTCASGILSRYEGDTTEKMIGGLLLEYISAACVESAEREAG